MGHETGASDLADARIGGNRGPFMTVVSKLL
jgi:hypothetical protein